MGKRTTTPDTQARAELSLPQLADRLVASIAKVMRAAKTEEDLRIGCEKTLEPLLRSLGVEVTPHYERSGGGQSRSVYSGRPDAVHGHLIIEYERPGVLTAARAVQHAHEQLVDYMIAEAAGASADPSASLARFVGAGFDGESIFFVHYAPRRDGKARGIDRTAFVRRGPFPFDLESARTFLTYLRALRRLPLTAEHLAAKFGPKSAIAPLVVSALIDALTNWGDVKVQVFFKEWQRLFGIVYGEQFGFHGPEEAAVLSQTYGVARETNFQQLLFSVHTYFALLIKLIAAELVTLNEGALTTSFSTTLAHGSRDDLVAALRELEDGGTFAKRGISNFLEGDFFRWYLDAFSPRLEGSVREVARALAEFEPATSTINPDSARDLLKKLYQFLVPQPVRHRLGEYYTPDWLAELLLDETGYDGDTRKRFLDPACGSGTFLVLAIQRARRHSAQHSADRRETAKRILAGIWGFDLNPLAVTASRTNYLFALGDLVKDLEEFEIPVYLADSVLWPERAGQMLLGGSEETVEVPTSVVTFHVPRVWVADRGFLMRQAAPAVERLAKQHYKPPEAVAALEQEGLVFPPHHAAVESFYRQVLELESQGKNGIWARFLKNAFAPMVAGKFDFVIGNPPWIRWGYLSKEYRAATLAMWKDYGLFSLKGHAARLGGGEKDFSMLFTYAAADHYLREGGRLGFLITQEVFKSKGAGEGFRRFRLGDRDALKVLKGHDLVTVQPFEGAANKTAAIVLEKGGETQYPVPYTVWTRKKGVGKIPTDLTLEEALPLLAKRKLAATPIGSPMGSWRTTSKGQENLGGLERRNAYKARLGARAEPYGVFWLEVKEVLANGDLLVRNLAEKGKRTLPHVEERIEADLVFPAVRGADIERWRAVPGIFVLMTQNPEKSAPFPEADMKSRWPRTFGYLLRFKDALLSRGSKTVRQFAERTEFYAMYGIGPYTAARCKVTWKRMAGDLVAAVVSQHKTPLGFKMVVPTDTTSFFATDDEAEAHYLCALVNSTPVREFIRSYSSAGRGFGAPSVMEHVGIRKFDPKNVLHKRLAGLSRELHALAAKGDAQETRRIEKELDEVVVKLFGVVTPKG
jgi:hypothetical protein